MAVGGTKDTNFVDSESPYRGTNQEAMEIFMDDFLVYGSSFEHCVENLEIVLQRC